MPNLPMLLRFSRLLLRAMEQMLLTSVGVKGLPLWRTSSRWGFSRKTMRVAPASSAFCSSSKMKWVRVL